MTDHVATRFARVTLVVVALCGGTSCTGPDAPERNSSAWTSDINRQGPADLRDGGRLRIEVAHIPPSFNSLHASTDPEYWPIAQATHPSAFVIRSDGVPEVNHDYFTSVELTNVNPQVVTYTINPKAVWTDGTPITWQDIASQVHAISGADPGFDVAATSRADRVASVTRGVDDRQAVVTFKTRYIEWRGMFSGGDTLLPRSVTATPEAFNTAAADAPSAGPFLISWGGKQVVVLSRNLKWWGRPPRLDTITFVRTDPNNRVQALRDRHVDVARLTSGYGVAAADLIKDVVIRNARERRWEVIGFNGRPNALLADERLRGAILQGIDRDGILSILQRGMVDYPVPLTNHVYVVGQQGHRDNAVKCNCIAARYDPDTARKELDDLGWMLFGDIRQKDGIPLSLDFVFQNTWDNWNLAKLLMGDLAEIGVKLNPRVADEHDLADGKFDLTRIELIDDGFPLKTMSVRYDSKGMLNAGKIGSADIDKKIAQTLAASDDATARDRANEVDVMLWKEVHSVPLGQSQGYVAVPANLANYGAFGAASIDFTAIGFTQ